MAPTEEDTVDQGDDENFQAFVSARMDRWRRTAFLMCQDWHTADDLVSVTITLLFRKWRQVRRADNPDAYAQRVLTRTWLSERRRPWRREQLPDRLPDPPPVREPAVPDQVSDRQSLALLLASLGPRQRAVLILRFYLDYSVEETAQELRVSVGTVKSQSARGLHALRVAAGVMRG